MALPNRSAQSEACFRIATSAAPGAVAVVELLGRIDEILSELLGGEPWPVGVCRLRSLADIDTVMIVRVSDSLAWLMPHGGPRIIQRLAQWLVSHSIAPVSDLDPRATYPEAATKTEAMALAAVSRAPSPLAIDLLLDQPRRWAEHAADPQESIDSIRARSGVLNRLITPPLVVVVGRPNVGKSTLTNALLGREGSITSPQQGTTRDYLISRIELAGLVVCWCDTPGRHETADRTELQAIALSSELIERADGLISAAAPGIDWPELPREADWRVHLKADCGPPAGLPGCDIQVSAKTGAGLLDLVERLKSLLIPSEILSHPGPWLFDDRIDQG